MSDIQDYTNQKAKQAALEKAGAIQVESTGLIQYHSRGRVAVIGAMDALEVAPRINEKLQATVVLTEGEEEPGVPIVPVGGRGIKLSGYLGEFDIQLGETGKPSFERLKVDLVLDLGAEPLLDVALKPPGYIHSSSEEPMLTETLTELFEMVGTFQKPLYYSYEPDLCAHSRSGTVSCTRCIDACPADAITSLAEAVKVDSNLCQGGGVCATVCPSGAMRYTYPRAKDTLEQIRTMLKTYLSEGGQDPILVLLTEADAAQPLELSNHLPLVLEEIASAGLEIWLSALAYGAKGVRLLRPADVPASVDSALQQQLLTVSEILPSMGYPANAVSLVEHNTLTDNSIKLMPPMTPATHSGMGGKRQLAYMAIDHLKDQAKRTKPMAILTVGAPFGTASVDQNKCTLCMSCVGACPGKALQAGNETPQLGFIEANCIQCGTCTRTCPEDAIWITPRLLLDKEKRDTKRVLQEEQPFLCTSCGKPFATQTMIQTMKKKLEGHWMFQDKRAMDRLTQCEDCRVIDIVQDQEAMDKATEGQTFQ